MFETIAIFLGVIGIGLLLYDQWVAKKDVRKEKSKRREEETVISRVGRWSMMLLIGFSAALIMTPIVERLYGVPEEFEGRLREYSPAASQTLGLIVIFCLIAAPFILNRFPWQRLRRLFAIEIILFIILITIL